MTIINNEFSTFPLVVHAQGISHLKKDWFTICEGDIEVKNFPEDVTIITFAQGNRIFPLIKQLDKNNISYINAIDPRVNYWINKFKIKYICDVINKIDTKYVLCLDAVDVLLAEDMGSLIERFELENTDILYNATVVDYPIMKVQEQTNGEFKYLNAGVFIGRTDKVKEFYKFILENYYERLNGNIRSEQYRVRVARQNYDGNIKVDTECKLFQTIGSIEYKIQDNQVII